MRRLAALSILVLGFGVGLAGSAHANAFGQHRPAHPIPGGNNMLGVYLLLGDQVDDVGLLGQVRFTSSSSFDWGLQLGFADAGDGAALIGADIRPILKRADSEFPLDLAFDAGIGLLIADEVTVLSIVPTLEASHRFELEGSDGALSPYGSLGLNINNVSVDGGDDDTDVDVIARFGLEWEATRKLQLIAEIGVGNGTDFTLGANIPF
ncbi:MAG: hypothetical protein ACREOU_04955 [Candidatus Eiseniibacteriota bacterium]